MAEGARELSGASFIMVLTPFMRAPPSLPNHLPKATPPNTVTSQGQVNFEGHKHPLCNIICTPLSRFPSARLRSPLGLQADTPNTGIAIPLLGHHATVALRDVHILIGRTGYFT